ncbi:GNAT family N-acetyltransferase [Flavilitoribacter nigricans]|uniref:GNAT family N-acetyltransferase n=1 Tax=Flavilitoribacter nigricans (strain ATCC 23147 / DSM 23189 / NBRC 102662 / NCIMB 1420 / SS-2) TaxID=1122177 RepID=A0A2D0N3Q1_FLAN2|nr:GNAT family N-acetyltransferase [Flavilitoribacter nigricans]PHN03135.1 GNAT family N-acetyltransferase [Flavilitoribacter nigricans DSM 23189 = NBRC 102662]
MIRPYRLEDKPVLLELLRLNIPRYFAPSEEQDFVEYLDQHLESYFVVEEDGQLIGAGGINYTPDGTEARISWDFLHPNWQRRGIGKKLILHRIAEIKKDPDIRAITVRTSQLAYTFYQKMGFELLKTEKDFWAEGFDLYEMKLVVQ